MSDKVLLSYKDSLIHESDFRLLDNSQWLNDTIIGFFYEIFENELFANEFKKDLIAFVNPSVVQILSLLTSRTEAEEFCFKPLNLASKKYILLPLNDNVENCSGGTHWSLIFVSRPERIFYHLDSFGMNKEKAIVMYQKFRNEFGCLEYRDLLCPQQNNNSDCGVYVLAFSEAIAECVKRSRAIALAHITPAFISEYRKKCKSKIKEKIK